MPENPPVEGDRAGLWWESMTETPWGNSEELRRRRLSPGPGKSSAEVEQNQRERLYGATVAAIAQQGYAATSVADLLALSGVSRSSFYRYFEDKLACFLATMEEILKLAAVATANRLRRARSWEEGAERGLRGLFELIVAQPAAARLCLVEADAAGPRATELLEDALERFREVVEETFGRHPSPDGMPAEMVEAMIGGLRLMVHTRLRHGTEGELLDLAGELLELDLSYLPPPKPLRGRRGARMAVQVGGSESPSRSAEAGERIARATLACVAARGYAETSIADIVAGAGISRSTFYECFEGKEQALGSALYQYRLAMQAVTLPAFRRARNWPEAMRSIIRSACAFLASEPDFAEVAALHVYAAGPVVVQGRDRAIASLQGFLEESFAAHGRPRSRVASEAIVSSAYAMFFARVRAEGSASLPEIAPLATYMALSPFIGAGSACAAARGEAVEGIAATFAPQADISGG